jgi:mannose-6-phosphate isomerase-like protein (cupin superfamily)
MMATLTVLALAALAGATPVDDRPQVVQRPPVQAPPPATPQAPQRPVTPAAPPAAAPRASIAIGVTDLGGSALPDVKVTVDGPVLREGVTGKDGVLKLQGLRVGTYRIRFEAKDFITFEREVVVKATMPIETDVALNRAPARAPEPQPAAPSPQAPASRPQPPPVEAGTSVDVRMLPDWIEQNLVGRNEPLKETTIARTPGATATVVQVRDPLKDRVRADADEMLYVIAGQGVLRFKGRDLSLDAGAFAVIPRGVTYTLERRGRNPLIALSIVGQ